MSFQHEINSFNGLLIKNLKNMVKIDARFETDKSQKCLAIYNAWRYCFQTNL